MTIRKAESCYEMSFLFVMTSLYVGYECCTLILWNEEVFNSEHILLMIFSKKSEDFFSWQYVRSSKLTKWRTVHIRTFFLMIFSDGIFFDKFEQVFINKIEETPNWWNQEIFPLETFSSLWFSPKELEEEFFWQNWRNCKLTEMLKIFA